MTYIGGPGKTLLCVLLFNREIFDFDDVIGTKLAEWGAVVLKKNMKDEFNLDQLSSLKKYGWTTSDVKVTEESKNLSFEDQKYLPP